MTKAELIKALEKYPDDTKILVYNEWYVDDDEEFESANRVKKVNGGIAIFRSI